MKRLSPEVVRSKQEATSYNLVQIDYSPPCFTQVYFLPKQALGGKP